MRDNDTGIETIPGELENLPDDITLIIRDGLPYLGTPVHEQGTRIPEDFLIMLAVARSWHDPGFRKLMLKVMRADAANGDLDGIVDMRKMQ